MNSAQINTRPTLKQFATLVEGEDLIVTSKLGTSTLSRVRFKKLDYPAAVTDRAEFIKEKVMQNFPQVETVLGAALWDQCICDQAEAVNKVLGN